MPNRRPPKSKSPKSKSSSKGAGGGSGRPVAPKGPSRDASAGAGRSASKGGRRADERSAGANAKAKAKPFPKDAPTISAPWVTLSPAMLTAWQRTVLKLAKLPRGTNRSEHTEEELLDLVLRQETKAVAELWEIFTQERENLTKNLLGPQRNVVAYLLGFHLANAARAQLALQRAAERHPLATWLNARPGRLVWNDLGAGTGAVAHAALDFLAKTAGFPPGRLEARIFDNTGTLLDAAATLLETADLCAITRTHKVPLERLEPLRFTPSADTAITGFSLGYVWNELKRNPVGRRKILATLTSPIERQEAALVVILEPGIQELARDAMELRDDLVTAGYVPLYPCPAATACPMRERPRDWCYSEGLWRRPRAVQRLDRVLGMDRSHLSGAFYVFASPALMTSAPLKNANTAPVPVVVGRPHVKDAFEYLLCEGETLGRFPAKREGPPVARGLPLPPSKAPAKS